VEEKKGIRMMTEVKYFFATWLNGKLVVAPLRRRSPLDKGSSLV
jgi:hypothetical protein